MTEQDRALRALSLKIVDEMRVHVAAFRERDVMPGDPGFRSAAETLNAGSTGALSRYLPRLPIELPTAQEMARVFKEQPNVLADPTLLYGFDPKVDPVMVVRSTIVSERMPIYLHRCEAFLKIADHYRKVMMDFSHG